MEIPVVVGTRFIASAINARNKTDATNGRDKRPQ